MYCARAVRRVGYLVPLLPDGQGDRSDYRVPIRRHAQILTRSKNSDNELKQTVFPTGLGIRASMHFSITRREMPGVGEKKDMIQGGGGVEVCIFLQFSAISQFSAIFRN